MYKKKKRFECPDVQMPLQYEMEMPDATPGVSDISHLHLICPDVYMLFQMPLQMSIKMPRCSDVILSGLIWKFQMSFQIPTQMSRCNFLKMTASANSTKTLLEEIWDCPDVQMPLDDTPDATPDIQTLLGN